MPYATTTDVAGRLGRELTTEEMTLAAVRLAEVERKILRRIPDLVEQIAAETIDVADVVQVEADAVLRVVRNPDGFVAETDGNYAYTLPAGAKPGALFIPVEDWATLGVYTSRLTVLTPLHGG